jgi:hypothetical protein
MATDYNPFTSELLRRSIRTALEFQKDLTMYSWNLEPLKRVPVLDKSNNPACVHIIDQDKSCSEMWSDGGAGYQVLRVTRNYSNNRGMYQVCVHCTEEYNLLGEKSTSWHQYSTSTMYSEYK